MRRGSAQLMLPVWSIQEGRYAESSHSPSPVSLCLKSGDLGLRLSCRLSQNNSGSFPYRSHKAPMVWLFSCSSAPTSGLRRRGQAF
jgi:hypothetical protein